MNEEERLQAAEAAINTALQMFKVHFVWACEFDGEMWLECDEYDEPEKPKARKPKLAVVN